VRARFAEHVQQRAARCVRGKRARSAKAVQRVSDGLGLVQQEAVLKSIAAACRPRVLGPHRLQKGARRAPWPNGHAWQRLARIARHHFTPIYDVPLATAQTAQKSVAYMEIVQAFYDELSLRVGDYRIIRGHETPREAHCVIYGGTEAPADVVLYIFAHHRSGYVCVNQMRSTTFDVRDMRLTVDVVMDLYNRIYNGRYEGRPPRY
jgi:hypothetical protein